MPKQNNLPENIIYCCDVLEGLRLLDDDSVDIIIADPPYNIGKDYGIGASKDKLPMDKYVSWCNDWIKESMRIIKCTGTIYIYGFTEVLARVAYNHDIKKQRFLIWHYTNKNSPRCFFWQRSHESILCLWKGKKNPIFNRDDVRVPYSKGTRPMHRMHSKTSKYFGSSAEFFIPHEKGAQPRDVLKINTLSGFAGGKERILYCKGCEKIIKSNERLEHDSHGVLIHPTQKPLELTEKLIKAAKPKGEEFTTVILFCGSGSECVATLNQGGNFIAFESNHEFVLLANEYLKEKFGGLQQNLFA
jgi:site-specific DNA-methyltransferase (adenine-specific)